MLQTKFGRHITYLTILLIAFALRISSINQLPAGLSHDEAYNGITAIEVLNGHRNIFFEINKGIEPLIIYLEALAFYLFGIGPVQLRVVNIIFGMLTVALIFPLTARLFNGRVAGLAMAGVTISFWAIFVSRLTLRAVLLPPLLLLTLYFFWRALQPTTNSKSPNLPIPNLQSPILQSPTATLIFFALSGLLAGITMYTYLSSRFIPFIILTVFGYQLLCQKVSKIHWLGLLVHFVIWGLIFVPLGSYFWENSESFTHRSNQVTTIPHALNGEFSPILKNTARTLGMFTLRGDTTDRYNLDGRPVFDWLNGLLFYLGLTVALWRLWRTPRNTGSEVLIFSTLFFMLLPDFITDDSPHFLRTIGALPIVYIFWAIGVVTVIQQLQHWLNTRSVLSPLAKQITLAALILLLLILTTAHTSYDYFYRWATSTEAQHIYGADIADIATYIKDSSSNDLTVISAEYYQDLDPFRLALHFQGHPPFVLWFDGRQTLAFPPPESSLVPRYAFPTSAPAAQIWANLLQVVPEESGQNYTLYRLLDTSALQQLQMDFSPLNITINDDLVLTGYKVLGQVTTGGKFQLLLSWQALRTLPPGTDYTFLVQLSDAQGKVWAKADGNGYAPGDWQPGVQALQLLTLRLPQDLPQTSFNLTVTLVNRRTGEVLPTSTGDRLIPLEVISKP